MSKILILIPDDYAAGGLQRSAVALRDCLASGGHQITLYTIRVSPGGLATTRDDVRRVMPTDASGLLGWFGFVRALRRLLQRERPHAAIGFGVVPAVLVAMAAPANILRVGSDRAFPPSIEGKRIYALMRRLFFRRLDYVVCQTSGIARWFEQTLGLDRKRVVIIPNVVRDPSKAWSPTRFAKNDDEPRKFVGIGRLDRQKGFDLALQAFAKVAEADAAATLSIYGEGPLRADLLALRHSLGLDKRVEFHPPTPDLEAVWKDAYALLFTSRYEGFPNVLAEAMAHGVPAVAFDCPTGPSDLIADGENGFLLPLGDVDGAAQRCLDLIANPAARDRMGMSATHVSQAFNFSKVAQQWNSLMTGAPDETSLASATNVR